MSRPALLSEADGKRLAAIAKKSGVTIEVEIDGRIIRIIPIDAKKSETTNLPTSLG